MDNEDDRSVGVLRQRILTLEEFRSDTKESLKDLTFRMSAQELWKSKVEDIIKSAPVPVPKDTSKYNWAAIIIAALTAIGLIAAAI